MMPSLSGFASWYRPLSSLPANFLALPWPAFLVGLSLCSISARRPHTQTVESQWSCRVAAVVLLLYAALYFPTAGQDSQEFFINSRMLPASSICVSYRERQDRKKTRQQRVERRVDQRRGDIRIIREKIV